MAINYYYLLISGYFLSSSAWLEFIRALLINMRYECMCINNATLHRSSSGKAHPIVDYANATLTQQLFLGNIHIYMWYN